MIPVHIFRVNRKYIALQQRAIKNGAHNYIVKTKLQ